MQTASEALHFERAKEYRDLIGDLKLLQEKQNITLNDFIDRDVVGYAHNHRPDVHSGFLFTSRQVTSTRKFHFPLL